MSGATGAPLQPRLLALAVQAKAAGEKVALLDWEPQARQTRQPSFDSTPGAGDSNCLRGHVILNPAVEVLAGRNFDAGLQPGRVVNCVTPAP
jgi:hypothetical protein